MKAKKLRRKTSGKMEFVVETPPFVQIAVAAGANSACDDMLYALDDDGRVWSLYCDGKSEWSLLTNHADSKASCLSG